MEDLPSNFFIYTSRQIFYFFGVLKDDVLAEDKTLPNPCVGCSSEEGHSFFITSLYYPTNVLWPVVVDA